MGRWRDRLLGKSQRSTRQEPTVPTKGASIGFVGTVGSSGQEPTVPIEPTEGAFVGFVGSSGGDVSKIQNTPRRQEYPEIKGAPKVVDKLSKGAATAVTNENAVRVFFSDILAIPVAELGTCRYCSKAQWWTKTGAGDQQVCGICHPNPHKEELVSDAA